MQKIRKNASILIWAIFLSLMISISFISISTKINSSIKTNHKLIGEHNLENYIKNKIKNKDYSNELLWNNETIIFTQNKSYSWSLKDQEKLELNFTIESNITINIIKWWPILANWWLIETNSWFTVNWNLTLENLWWYTNFSIISNNNLPVEEYMYIIKKTIWNKEVVKTRWIIKNN